MLDDSPWEAGIRRGADVSPTVVRISSVASVATEDENSGPHPTVVTYGDTWIDVYHSMLSDVEGETISQKINRLREMAGLEKWK